jgi:hypothetical protein
MNDVYFREEGYNGAFERGGRQVHELLENRGTGEPSEGNWAWVRILGAQIFNRSVRPA